MRFRDLCFLGFIAWCSIGTALLAAYMQGKEEMRYRESVATQLIMQEADYLTAMQIARAQK